MLILLSEGYPPDRGRLHTCSSPVRRSHPEGIPPGLHVLGLPLAFILSQDQTLHCIFFVPRRPIEYAIKHTRAPPLTWLYVSLMSMILSLPNHQAKGLS